MNLLPPPPRIHSPRLAAPRSRRGILNLSDIGAYVALIIIAVLLFLLFLLVSKFTDDKYVDADIASSAAATSGTPFVQSYLRTPLDIDPAVYGAQGGAQGGVQEGVQGGVPSATGTFAQRLPAALDDPSCFAWLAKIGAAKDAGEARAQEPAPNDACAAILARTHLFFRAACGDAYALLLTRDGQTILVGPGIESAFKKNGDDAQEKLLALVPDGSAYSPTTLKDPSASILVGRAVLPAKKPFTLTAVCVEKYGVALR